MAQCKHHEICGLTDEFDPKEGLCILHSHQRQKDQQAFADARAAHRKAKGDQFGWMVFPGRANFNGVTFTQAADFNGATFTKCVYFIHATFIADADFHGATFTGRANFSNATFIGRADFSQTTFTADADFHEATFEQAANFGKTSFAFQEVIQFLPVVTTDVGATFIRPPTSAGRPSPRAPILARQPSLERVFSEGPTFLDTPPSGEAMSAASCCSLALLGDRATMHKR